MKNQNAQRFQLTLKLFAVSILALLVSVSSSQRLMASESNQAADQEVEALHKQADQGDAGAQFDLAVRYYDGEGVTRDAFTAARWYHKAAEQGDARAQFDLAYLYFTGEGVEQDTAAAAHWYRKAADQGDPRAQFNLAFLFYKGQGVAQDLSVAIDWYRRAAELGYAKAQFNLGLLHYKGEGVAADSVKAWTWMAMAAAQDVEAAVFARDTIASELTEEQMVQARTLVDEMTARITPYPSID